MKIYTPPFLTPIDEASITKTYHLSKITPNRDRFTHKTRGWANWRPIFNDSGSIGIEKPPVWRGFPPVCAYFPQFGGSGGPKSGGIRPLGPLGGPNPPFFGGYPPFLGGRPPNPHLRGPKPWFWIGNPHFWDWNSQSGVRNPISKGTSAYFQPIATFSIQFFKSR